MLENITTALIAACAINLSICIYGAIYPRKWLEVEKRLYKSSENGGNKKISGLLRPRIREVSGEDKTVKEIKGTRRQCILIAISMVLVSLILYS